MSDGAGNTTPGLQSYPSPSQAARLPFYQFATEEQPPPQSQPQAQSQPPEHQDERSHEHHNEHRHEPQHEPYPLPPHHQDEHHHEPYPLPQGSAHHDEDPPEDERREVPDDPQMRANLERMMGGLGSMGSSFNPFAFASTSASTSTPPHEHAPPQPQPGASTAPESSIAFSHLNGSPDAAPPPLTTTTTTTTRDKAPRSKVSRACDECRRKKIRCDAMDETGATACTSCLRTGLRCAFSRQPMKRGPSKGYIKELAERLHSLEQQVHEPGLSGQHQAEIQQVQRAIAESVQQGYGQGQQALQSVHGVSTTQGQLLQSNGNAQGQQFQSNGVAQGQQFQSNGSSQGQQFQSNGSASGQQLQSNGSAQGQRFQSNGGAQAGQNGAAGWEPRIGEKRSHAVSEGVYNEQTSPGWNNHRPPPPPLQQQPAQQTSSQQLLPQPPSQTPSQSQLPPPMWQQSSYAHSQPPTPSYSNAQPFWRTGASDNRQESTSLPYDPEMHNTTTITSFDWDESVITEYYRIIHQTFPLLPNNKNRLRQRLAECPTSLREAFLAALDCLMRTFPTTTLPPNSGYPQALKRAAELLAKYPFDHPSTHTSSTNLVYLQTLLLMALESDNHGPATIRGQAGPSRAEWLGRAAGVAGQIQINTIQTTSQSVMEGDRDSEDRIARRVWWVLFILDRWHASSTADLLKLPENSVILLPEDQILLGESTYHLARLSFIIGHLASILTTTKTPSTDVMAPSNPASSLLGLTLAGEIDRFRESVESVWGSLNLVHLSYHHCHLLIKRLNPTTEPVELIGHAVKVATVLNSRLTPVTPLNHHFAALAAMTLCELCDVPKTRAEALRGLDQMVECLGQGRGLAGKQESEGWDGAIRDLVIRKKERMLSQGGADGVDGLQGLADAAVQGSTASASASAAHHSSEAFDPTMLTRYGYLTALGQGIFKSN